LDIIADILELCTSAGRLRKTHIMQQANLSSTMTNDYLEYMLARELLQCGDNRHYTVTEKGFATLMHYQRIIELAIQESNKVVNVH
jgi:predicted transcriptional regulator